VFVYPNVKSPTAAPTVYKAKVDQTTYTLIFVMCVYFIWQHFLWRDSMWLWNINSYFCSEIATTWSSTFKVLFWNTQVQC